MQISQLELGSVGGVESLCLQYLNQAVAGHLISTVLYLMPVNTTYSPHQPCSAQAEISVLLVNLDILQMLRYISWYVSCTALPWYDSLLPNATIDWMEQVPGKTFYIWLSMSSFSTLGHRDRWDLSCWQDSSAGEVSPLQTCRCKRINVK